MLMRKVREWIIECEGIEGLWLPGDRIPRGPDGRVWKFSPKALKAMHREE